MKPREAAFVSLQRMENSAKYLNIEADAAIRKNKLEGADRALYTKLLYGTAERQITLDYLIGRLSSRPIDKIDPNVRIILRLSLYQLRYLDRVPEYAVCNDAAELTRRFAKDDAVGFVNGILRSYLRTGKDLSLPRAEDDYILYLSVRYSAPEWLCRLFCDGYGKGRAERILAAFDEAPTVTLAVNTLRCTREELIARLKNDGIRAEKCAYSEVGVRLCSHVPTEQLTVLSEGLCFVQDESSQLCAALVGAGKGEKILDACACPGGKSFAMAIGMHNEGSIDSCDLHENKLSLVTKGAQTLGISCIRTEKRDGGVFDGSLEGTYDRVLCDVPCSGLGVIAKKPDIKMKKEEEITRLPAVQKAILENCARYVKPGGVLVYSTCTLNPAENERQIEAFLSSHPEFSLCKTPIGARLFEGAATLIPDEMKGCDGFFAAKMVREKS